MKKEYKQALAEVNTILENTEEEIRNKIPNGFMNFIKENMDKEHEIKLDFNKRLIEQDITKETREILALIYRDYLCTKEERELLLKQEKEEQDRIEKEKQEKYNINFNTLAESRRQKNIEQRLETESQMSLIEVIEEKWYKKIINKILKIFKIRK